MIRRGVFLRISEEFQGVFYRQKNKLIQEEFAERPGVALTVTWKIEQGKENLNLIKVNEGLKIIYFLIIHQTYFIDLSGITLRSKHT